MTSPYDTVSYGSNEIDVLDEGGININARPAFSYISKAKAQSDKALFPMYSDTDSSMLRNEWAFSVNNNDVHQFHGYISPVPEVLTCLNGLFADANQMFPDDEEQVKTSIMASIRIQGINQQVKMINASESEHTSSMIPIQVMGKSKHKGVCAMPPGIHAKLNFYTPSQLKLMGRTEKRATFHVEPYIAKNLASMAVHNLRAYLRDESKYKKGMNINLLTTNALISSNESFCNFALSSMLLGMWALANPHLNTKPIGQTPAPHILDIGFAINHGFDKFNSDYNLSTSSQIPPTSAETTLNGLAVALRVIEQGSDPLTGLTIDTKKKKIWGEQVRLRILRTIFLTFDPNDNAPIIENFEYGFNSVTRKNERGKKDSGMPRKDTCTGRMLINQLQHFPSVSSAIANLFYIDLSFVWGKVTTGCSTNGGTVEIVR
jgi:hypothetical protein